LRTQLAARQLSPRHAQDLLTAFRMDVTKLRYRDWDDLIGYCTYSAMPVGRFVLDVHGESRALWGANDALCAALQIINHLQDCAKDYRSLDRVYIPLDAFAAADAAVESLAADRASPALLGCISKLARRTGVLLRESRPFSAGIDDTRLALEVAVIQTLAERLIGLLSRRDPLSERVHLGKAGVAGFGLLGLIWGASRRVGRVFAAGHKPQDA
jgi:hydroxysqualene synthase